MFSFWRRGCNLLSIFWFGDLTSLIYVNNFSLLYTEEDDMYVTPWSNSWLMIWAVLCLTSPPCSNSSFPLIYPQVSICISNAYSFFLNCIMWHRSILENTSPRSYPVIVWDATTNLTSLLSFQSPSLPLKFPSSCSVLSIFHTVDMAFLKNLYHLST